MNQFLKLSPTTSNKGQKMLEYMRVNVNLEFAEHISSYFLEALIRGALGYKLRDLICINKKLKNCHECLIKKTCAFALTFYAESDNNERTIETPSLPPPVNFFVYKKGAGMNQFVEITLFKPMFNFFNHIAFALIELGKEGISKNRIRFQVNSIVDTSNGNIIFDGNSLNVPEEEKFDLNEKQIISDNKKELTIQFLTPLRLIRNNKPVYNIPFYEIIKSSLIRYSVLSENYGDSTTVNNAKCIIDMAKEVEMISSELQWKKHERYSTKQEQIISFGGVTGTVKYHGNVENFHTILHFGSLFGIGKNTSFGCGRFSFS